MSLPKTENIHSEVIMGYRALVKGRYTFDNLKKRADFPVSFNEKRVLVFRDYFLGYLYPPPEKRNELNEAFDSLDSYLKHPDKLFRLLVDSTSLIFKYGRHLPKILATGLKALRSFRSANTFEDRLVKHAMKQNMTPPYAQSDIEEMIKSLSRKQIDEFIESGQTLFETLYDRELVAKIKEIVQHLIKKMKKRPNIYGVAEVKGLEMGYDIISGGDMLFDQLNKAEKEKIFTFIVSVEREVLDQIFR